MTWIKDNRLLFAIILVAVCFFGYYIFTAFKWLPYPHSMDYGEGYMMTYAKMWADGMWKWDVTVPPYLTMAYGLGFPIMAYPLVKLFGAELWVGRLLSILATLVVCFLCYLIVKEITGRKVYGLIASLLPATQPAFRDWSAMARVDMPAVMFDILGLYLAIKFMGSKKFYLCIIPFILAVMVKQIAITAIVAVGIYLLIYNRKRLLVFSSLFILGLVVLIAPLMAISGGTYLKHIVLYMNGTGNFNWALFSALFPAFVYPFVGVLVLSLIYLRRNWRKKEYTLASVFFASAFIIDSFASSRTGSSCNYYFEAIFAGCICAPLILPYIQSYIKRGKLKLDFTVAFIVLISLFTIITPLFHIALPTQQYTDAMNEVKEIMSDTDKPIITENPAFALEMGQPPFIEFFIFTNMTRLGYWDATDYVNGYKNQYYDYVLLRVSLETRLESKREGKLDGHFSNAVLEQIRDNYTLVYESDDDCWLYDVFVYEANDKLKNDKRWR